MSLNSLLIQYHVSPRCQLPIESPRTCTDIFTITFTNDPDSKQKFKSPRRLSTTHKRSFDRELRNMVESVTIKWQGKEFEIALSPDDTVLSLKRKIEKETLVQPKRQKLLGMKARAGGLPGDDVAMGDIALKPNQKIMMMGTPDAEVAALDKMATAAHHVQDDFDLQEGQMAEVELQDRDENLEKVQKRISAAKVVELNPPRPGKKCVVLDIDYTIFDLNSSAERPEELARPFLHDFMSAVYPFYDIVIWSATSMKWVEVKMRELGVTTHPDYKVTLLMDHKSMVTVSTEKYGVFDCKPLQVLWGKYPDHYSKHNTIMLDDLRRNYVLNRQNGLVIRPYRKAHLTRSTDKELLFLKLYLLKISELESMSELRHSQWERHIKHELQLLFPDGT